MTAEEFLKNANIDNRCSVIFNGKMEIFSLDSFLEEYHQSKVDAITDDEIDNYCLMNASDVDENMRNESAINWFKEKLKK